METLNDELCAKVKTSVIVSSGPYAEFLKQQKRKFQSVNNARFFLRGGGILNQGLHQRSQISALCHGQKRSMQRPDNGAYKNFHLGFNHNNVNVQNLFLSLNAV